MQMAYSLSFVGEIEIALKHVSTHLDTFKVQQKVMSLSRLPHVRPAAGAAADLSTGDGSCEPACVADRGCFEVRKDQHSDVLVPKI